MQKKNCRKEQSIFKGTFFKKIKVPVNLMFKIAHFYLAKANWTQVQTYLNVSRVTLTDFFGWFRQILIDNINSTEEIIGGQGIIV